MPSYMDLGHLVHFSRIVSLPLYFFRGFPQPHDANQSLVACHHLFEIPKMAAACYFCVFLHHFLVHFNFLAYLNHTWDAFLPLGDPVFSILSQNSSPSGAKYHWFLSSFPAFFCFPCYLLVNVFRCHLN